MRRRLSLGAAAAAALALVGLALTFLRDGGEPPAAREPIEPAATTTSPADEERTPPASTSEPPPPEPSTGGVTEPAETTTPTAAAPPPVVPPAVQDTPLLVGVVEDTVKVTERAAVAQRMAMLRRAGFRALRMTTLWTPGQTRPTAIEGRVLANAVRAARANGIRVFLSVFHARARDAPTTAVRQREFAAFAASLIQALPSVRDLIVGNEPNLNNFWMPQFDTDGGSASPRDYNALLAATYDAVKGVSTDVRVLGGALGPRGGDNPNAPRHTHSPTRFLREWGRAYRASGRQAPVMDALAYHPYLEYSRLPPEFEHPRTTTIALADYHKLVAALADAFDGSAQAGSSLPVAYTEFGVQTRVPERLSALYENHGHPAAQDAVDRTTQAAYYARAIELAACQPTVDVLLLFLALDEPDLSRWQSGILYVDGSWKPSRTTVRRAAARISAGELAC
jgi:hypothetical protein